MKGLILAAGLGTRLQPLTGRVSKALLPLAGAALISYPLRSLLQAGISEIGIVGGANLAELRAGLVAYDAQQGGAAQLSWIYQPHPGGLAHAVSCARDFCRSDDFVLLFCDNLFGAELRPALELWQALRQAHGPRCGGLIHCIEVADPRAFGVAVLDDNGAVLDLEEKPQQPRSNQAVIGIDILNESVFEAASRIAPSPRGELEITDAIMELTRMGLHVQARRLPGWWFDTGTFASLLDALPAVMDELAATAGGRIEISPLAEVQASTFEAPVYIGPGCRVHGCRLGPYVSLEGDCELTDCQLERSLVYPGARLSGVSGELQLHGPQGWSFTYTSGPAAQP